MELIPELLDQCPRCGSKKIFIYEETIDCTECRNEFYIEDILTSPNPTLVLSIKEKMSISELFFLE